MGLIDTVRFLGFWVIRDLGFCFSVLNVMPFCKYLSFACWVCLFFFFLVGALLDFVVVVV